MGLWTRAKNLFGARRQGLTTTTKAEPPLSAAQKRRKKALEFLISKRRTLTQRQQRIGDLKRLIKEYEKMEQSQILGFRTKVLELKERLETLMQEQSLERTTAFNQSAKMRGLQRSALTPTKKTVTTTKAREAQIERLVYLARTSPRKARRLATEMNGLLKEVNFRKIKEITPSQARTMKEGEFIERWFVLKSYAAELIVENVAPFVIGRPEIGRIFKDRIHECDYFSPHNKTISELNNAIDILSNPAFRSLTKLPRRMDKVSTEEMMREMNQHLQRVKSKETQSPAISIGDSPNSSLRQ